MTDTQPLLSIRDLRIGFPGPQAEVAAVRGLSFDVHAGECVALVGPSGSGKTAVALAILRLVEFGGGRIRGGHILLRDPAPLDLTQAGPLQMRALRGDRIALVSQEPLAALNPVLRIGDQLAEGLRLHRGLSRRDARGQARDLLVQVAIPEADRCLRLYPHQLSGGMRQRVLIAMAIACQPRLLICDEPTTALDGVTQAGILALIDRLRRDRGMAVVLITHDMKVVARMNARVVAMPAEPPPSLAAPTIAAPVLHRSVATGPPILRVRGLTVAVPLRQGLRRSVLPLVRDLDLDLHPGQTLALLGPSGAGKTTAARAIACLRPACAGQVWLADRDLLTLRAGALRRLRCQMQMVFQDPFLSLDPQMRLGDQVAEPLLNFRLGAPSEQARRVAQLFARVGLPVGLMDAYPHQLSGGQRQRVAIARALAPGPRVLIADEAVSSLDAPLRGQVLDLLTELQRELGLAILFISHDMTSVARIADRVAVMEQGRIVETGPLAQILSAPRHPTTRALLAASGGFV